MIPVVNPIPEPPDFEVECRQKGNQWLADHPNAKSKSFPAHWTKFEAELEAGFHRRCGWWAMRIDSGTVDHYMSKERPASRHLVYEWSNYRHAAGTLNSSKKQVDDKVLDPFDVQAGWFEVLLPSMLLVRTNNVPQQLRDKADYTLTRLKLASGTKVRRNRKRWYEDYKANKITRDGLRDYAPLIAAAVERLEANHQPLP
jgi:hypothetical protein